MAHLVQRFLRRRSPMINFPSLINQKSQLQTLTLASFSQSIDSRRRSILPSPPLKADLEKTEVRYDFIYPSFSYGLTFNPVFQKLVTEEEKGVEEGENGLEKMWADSTKKKRKKKMNKHKYKKLMKRTRHST